MFRRILIANRGEVAARINRTCQALGIQTVAVASDADVENGWLKDVNQVVRIGPARASESYLNQNILLDVARRTGCSAVHPGWGFLSENSEFALRCASTGLTFVGPSARHMEQMGDKSVARATMKALGLPLIPGSDGTVESVEKAKELADQIGYPVMLKAVSGGGGRGMRLVRDSGELKSAFEAASAEAISCFGDGSLYMEKCIQNGRHVEVQILADGFGNCIHLGERECSIQRRHQKVIEEAPSPGLSEGERARILPLVADAVRRSGYVNAGTVEMLLGESGHLYFMEMNTRLQVEHCVTEENTGLDLVELQLRIAANQRLPIMQEDVRVQRHSIEFRINAEDPSANFRPSPGRVNRLEFPTGEGIRVDTHLRTGDVISPHYDSMVAKLIVSAADRAVCLSRAKEALAATCVEGVQTNLGLLQEIVTWSPFATGNYHTGSLESKLSRS